MSDWREGYRQALQETLLRSGQINESRDYYGSIVDLSTQIHRHGRGDGWYPSRIEVMEIPPWCGGWASIGTPTEEVHYEFMGTDWSGDCSIHTVEAQVTCNCGFITDRILEYRGTLSELIAEVLRDV